MQTLAIKALTAGLALVSMVSSNSTAVVQMPNTAASTPAIYSSKPIVAFEDESPLDYWIRKLVLLESEGKTDIKVLDHNGLHSFGCLQFQMSTFEEYALKYDLISDGSSVEEAIYDCELQKEIAKRMIRENRNNWRRWYTSVIIKGLGLPPKEEHSILLSLK
ncbi:MAG: hypothetical protein HY432_00805 [Candidatus Liptonbacteria bacterium]|nr:hypothetical protein [Candidatus Liptonbacteria bacterium]